MKTAKKTLLLALAAVMLVSATVMGTVAYLTSQSSVQNTFTIGKVAIEVNEKKVNPDGVPMENYGRVKSNEYRLLPGQTYVKDPTMFIKEGSELAYVRMIVKINEQVDLDAIFKKYNDKITDESKKLSMVNIFDGYDSSFWQLVKETEVDPYNRTYEFRYHTTVKGPDYDTNGGELWTELKPLFTGFPIPGFFTSEDLESIQNLVIDIEGHAIQAASFQDADEAWAAFQSQYNGQI